ncbi:NeuD/PglB/VioB family sugar acetyltransferase [uncultured Paracoccus sp.]|uniref:NeuD/PglB/VioB family sugar acetyltransferase n=1 Tax=uncultured Paracoccus sp. TaxID=189685 RepID=UPI002606AFAF|nr:NeuD/PglB/VioB family sugar acetyltransferase [uncultured Paracoccus sp.]
MQRLILLGAGGHADVVAEAIALSQGDLAGHLSPAPETDRDLSLLGPRLGDDAAIAALVAAGFGLVPGIGFVTAAGAERRADWLAALPAEALVTVIHPHAILSPSARLGVGSFMAPGAILGTKSRAGAGTILNSGAVVDHDCRLGANCHVATGARLAGGVTVGDNVLIGAGATVRQGVRIGIGAVVGAGAVVLRDVAPGVTVLGVPARPVPVDTA